MSIYSCRSRSNASWLHRATMAVAMLMAALSVHAGTLAPIESHYFGATLFVVQTGNTVWPPVGVNSLAQYDSTYGQTPGPAVDYGYQAARLFFANGGQTLYVIDPHGTTTQNFIDALAASAGLPVDLVAIPGAACCTNSLIKHTAIMFALSQHIDASPNRFGLVDAPLDSDPDALFQYRAGFSSPHTAIYAPWLVVNDPEHGDSINVPPSSAVAGIISRIDRENGIFKTPAGTRANFITLPPLTDLEREFSSAEWGQLNAANVNVLGKYADPGTIQIWGARTTSTDIELQYIAVTRFQRHLKFSMSRSLADIIGTSPAAANPATVEGLIADFLNDYWHQGAFQGVKTRDAYFADCTQESSKCLVGVSMLKPAEFSTFWLSIPSGDVIFASGFEVNEFSANHYNTQ